MVSKFYHVRVGDSQITVSWGADTIWKVPFSIQNWRMVQDFVKHATGQGYKVVETTV